MKIYWLKKTRGCSMHKCLIAILSILIVTIVIVTTNPQLHKPLAIGGSKIAITDEKVIQNKDVTLSNQDKTSSSGNININNSENVKNTENVSTRTIDADKNLEKLLKAQAQEDAKQTKKVSLTPTKNTTAKKTVKTTNKSTQKTAVAPAKKTTTTKQTSKVQPVQTTQKAQQTPKVTEQEVKKQLQKVLTEYEETILWNRWRANVANTVAEKLNPSFSQIIPLGTIYRYDFDVNNKRQISNIRVRLTKGYINATTNQGAVMLRNAITSLNNSSVLAFPGGTNRTSVTVSSGVERTETSRPINESAFDDAEKIIKQIYQYQ